MGFTVFWCPYDYLPYMRGDEGMDYPMKILHISPHLGGGVGTVIMDWIDKDINNHYKIALLDYANDKAKKWWLTKNSFLHSLYPKMAEYPDILNRLISEADIVLIHYWDHPMLADLFAGEIPDCRMVFWCHKNIKYPWKQVRYPDRFIDTSPVQTGGSCYSYIWSTGNMERFLAIEPKPHEGFNIGYVGTVDYKKIHPNFISICNEIMKFIPDVHFTFIGDVNKELLLSFFQPPPLPPLPLSSYKFTFTGNVDDVAPYLAEMDVFGYSLRPDHYGTCEIVLGEAMATGIPCVVMNNPVERTIITDTFNGFIGDETYYIGAIELLYRQPGLRIGVGINARNHAGKLYSIDTMIASWEQVFQEMIQKPKTRKEGLK